MFAIVCVRNMEHGINYTLKQNLSITEQNPKKGNRYVKNTTIHRDIKIPLIKNQIFTPPFNTYIST